MGLTLTVPVPSGPTGTSSRGMRVENRSCPALPPVLEGQATLLAEKGEGLPGTIWCIPPRKK